MLPAVVKSALVVLIAFLLKLLCDWIGIPISEEMLTALAVALVAWILGEPAGVRVHKALFGE